MLIKLSSEQTFIVLRDFSDFQRYCNMTITFIDSHLHETLDKKVFIDLLNTGIKKGEIFYEGLSIIASKYGFESKNFDFNMIFEHNILEINESTDTFNATNFFIKSMGLLPEFEAMVRNTLKEKE